MWSYVLIPLLGSPDILEHHTYLTSFSINGCDTSVELLTTAPIYGFCKLGSVIDFWRVPCLVVGRALGLNNYTWWRPFKRFRFQ